MTARRLMVLMAGLLLASSVLSPAGALAAAPTITAFSVHGSPFAEDFAPLPQQATIKLVLAHGGRVTVTVRRPNGAPVRRLAYRIRLTPGEHAWTWDGLRSDGAMALDGRFSVRVRVENGAGVAVADRPLRKGLPQIYPANPGVIVITVDPGHGGRFNNAHGPGLKEKVANLDIGLQLQALLEHAGVEVVMTRTTDVAVNEPASDENGDGKLNRYDDDLERNDVANIAGSDAAIHVHNNGSNSPVSHGTGTYTDPNRTFTPLATDLATVVQAGQVESLAAYRSAVFNGVAYVPRDRGVRFGWYYYMGPYDPPYLPRPALTVGVLTESLFLSNAADLEALKQPEVRLSIAAGIYLGVAEWLNTRDYGAGYEPLSAPASAAAGESLVYRIRLTNRGNLASAGWTLRLGAVPTAPLYDGSGEPGTEIGAVAVPDGLAPGASVELDIPAVAPADAGDWLVKADVALADATRLSDHGIVVLQMPLTTTIAP